MVGLGRGSGPTWVVLGADQCLCGWFLSALGASVGGPGSLSGAMWAVLGRSWGDLGLLLGLCGRSWVAPGIYVGGLGPLLEPMLASWRVLGPK